MKRTQTRGREPAAGARRRSLTDRVRRWPRASGTRAAGGRSLPASVTILAQAIDLPQLVQQGPARRSLAPNLDAPHLRFGDPKLAEVLLEGDDDVAVVLDFVHLALRGGLYGGMAPKAALDLEPSLRENLIAYLALPLLGPLAHASQREQGGQADGGGA
mmetsp:Transcript_2265/g.6329  ORF Transcript_2265/g.6329 Transcript_2265/m.6329 type:complete len:159 (-) Transcript_2265:100-576(-)